jgi:hypothetical protein
MFRLKIILLNLIFLVSFSICFGQSFTYSGPTTLTIPFGQSNSTGTYYFNYSDLDGLCYDGLIIAVDGDVINNDLCNDPETPSSYQITFTEGSHTVQFSLLSINCKTLNCFDPIVHQVVQFTVDCRFKVRVENEFGAGTISVDGGAKTSPYDRTSLPGNNVPIGAIEQVYNNYNRVWNTNGTNLSEWERQHPTSGTSFISSAQSTTYAVQSNDVNTKIIAKLKREFKIDIDYQTEFDGLQTDQKTFNIVELNSGQISSDETKTINNKSYRYSYWTDDLTATRSRTITPTDHDTKTAFFKYPHHSNDNTTFSSNNQNKFVKSPNGHLHVVYESLGKIWYEVSTDNGSTWTIKNGGKPLSNITSKNPSIECS